MEQKKIEKLIWDISAKTKIPDIPDKKNTWKNNIWSKGISAFFIYE